MNQRIGTKSLGIEKLGGMLLFFYSFTLPFDYHFYPNFFIRASFLIVSLFLLIGGEHFRIKKGKLEFIDFLVFPMLFFILYNSGDIKEGLYTNVFVYIIIFCFYYVMRNTTKWWSGFCLIARVTTLAYAVITILSYISRPFFENIVLNVLDIYRETLLSQYNSGWMPGATNHYSVNAIYITLGIIMYLPSVLERNKRSKRQLRKIYFVLLIYLIALFMTGKRAHIIFSLIAFYITYYFSTADKPRYRLIKIIGGLVGVSLLVIALANFVPFIATFIERFKYQLDIGDVSSGRGILIQYALNEFTTHRWVGIGWNEFENLYFSRYSVQGEILNVHNVYIQLLTEVGIIGFIVFLLFFFGNYYYSVKSLVQKRKRSDTENEDILLISVFLQSFFLIYCMTGNPLYDMNIFFPYMAVCTISKSVRTLNI